MTLTEFLLARIAEDEARARIMWEEKVRRRAVGAPTSLNWPTPDRTLAECEAKRRIVAHVVEKARYVDTPADAVVTLRLLALPFADHPDYRDEWKP